jgi:hypothetical protein
MSWGEGVGVNVTLSLDLFIGTSSNFRHDSIMGKNYQSNIASLLENFKFAYYQFTSLVCHN